MTPSLVVDRAATPFGRAHRSSLLSSNRRGSGNLLTFAVDALAAQAAATAALPIKEQLALMASALTPISRLVAHDTVVSTLHVVLDPPALISTTSEHVAYLWTLGGEEGPEPMGALDPVRGLAAGYAQSAGAPPAVAAPSAAALASHAASVANGGPVASSLVPWNFNIDVASRTKKDRLATLVVMQELDGMVAKMADMATSEAASEASRRSSAAQSAARSPAASGAASLSSSKVGSRHSSRPTTALLGGSPAAVHKTSASSAAAPASEEKESTAADAGADRSKRVTRALSVRASDSHSAAPSPDGAVDAASFFMSTPMSPVNSLPALSKHVLSPGQRVRASLAAAPATPAAAASSPSKSATKSAIASPVTSKPVSAGVSAANTNRSQRSTSEAADD